MRPPGTYNRLGKNTPSDRC
uniref:Uncharacterized protein n=1 Tax=Anguilla anguilla TaxID=7936 RepID=A0A0E9Y0K5_ANGAN